jgi:anti-sigma-K factor RskA
MNNDDEFEKKLQSLTSALHRPDPTPEWKADILARAMREADAARQKRTLLPPRWLMVTWGTAWAAIVVLNFAAPQTSIQTGSPQIAAPSAAPGGPAAQTLLAYNRQLNLSIDLP